jgi:hypothetical protein
LVKLREQGDLAELEVAVLAHDHDPAPEHPVELVHD